MKKIILSLGIALSFISNIAAAEVKPIRFAMEATYPPFEFVDESGQIKGFDVDIAKALCTQIKAECTFSHQPFSSFVAPLAKHYTVTTLNGKTIGVQSGSTFEKYLNEKYSGQYTVKTYASI